MWSGRRGAAGWGLAGSSGRARRHPPAAGAGPGPADAAQPAYFQLYCIGRSEPSYPVRLAAAQEVGAGGDHAFAVLEDRLGPELAERRPGLSGGGRDQLEQWWRECITRAWLAPLLVGSVTGREDDARDNLQRWLDFVADQDARAKKGGLSLSLEVALAQGFKHTVNRRRRHAHAEARAYLAEQAREMLRHTRFWFTRLTLVHALCLWAREWVTRAISSSRPGSLRASRW